MAANIQVFPSAGAPLSITVNGRKYTATPGGAPLIVPDFDANVLISNGWQRSAKHGAGTTAQRPANPDVNFEYFDSTLGANVIWNGKNWIHHGTGASS